MSIVKDDKQMTTNTQTNASKLLDILKAQDTTPDNSVPHESLMTVDELRAWLHSLPEPTPKELQDYLWHERD